MSSSGAGVAASRRPPAPPALGCLRVARWPSSGPLQGLVVNGSVRLGRRVGRDLEAVHGKAVVGSGAQGLRPAAHGVAKLVLAAARARLAPRSLEGWRSATACRLDR